MRRKAGRPRGTAVLRGPPASPPAQQHVPVGGVLGDVIGARVQFLRVRDGVLRPAGADVEGEVLRDDGAGRAHPEDAGAGGEPADGPYVRLDGGAVRNPLQHPFHRRDLPALLVRLRLGEARQRQRRRQGQRGGGGAGRQPVGVLAQPRPPTAAEDVDGVDEGQHDHRHQDGAVVPVGAPVVVVGRQEAPAERGQRDDQQRRAQGEQPGGGDQQPGEGAQLGVEPAERPGGRAALADLVPVVVRADRVEGRDDQGERDDGGGGPERGDAEGVGHGLRVRAAGPQGHHQADGGEHLAEVLLDEDQRQRPQQRGPPALPQQGFQGERDQRYGEADLVEVEVGGALDAPGQSVRDAHREARGAPQQPGRRARDGDGGDGEEQGLCDEQRDGGGEEAVGGREERRDGAEVVAEDVGAGPLEVGDRHLEVRVGPHGLLEDPEVPGTALHTAVPADGQHGVGEEQRRREEIRDAVPDAVAP